MNQYSCGRLVDENNVVGRHKNFWFPYMVLAEAFLSISLDVCSQVISPGSSGSEKLAPNISFARMIRGNVRRRHPDSLKTSSRQNKKALKHAHFESGIIIPCSDKCLPESPE